MQTHQLEFTCYEVTEPDGGGIESNHVAYFSSETVAKQYAEQAGKSWPKNVKKRYVQHKYIILDRVEEVEILKVENLRSSALAKLTPDERKALGL